MNSLRSQRVLPGALAALVALIAAPSYADAPRPGGTADWVRRLDGRVLPPPADPAEDPAGMLARDVRLRIQEANLRESRAWEAVETREDWERFRETRLRALADSIGRSSVNPEAPRTLVTRTLDGDGYRIDNLVIESRPGLIATANLYRPAEPSRSMPAILVSHSHHNPATQGELQDMGMTWARAGCLVLVMEHLGHGERRQHPFATEADYPAPFRVGRQDYYFRHIEGAQLHVVGESLMGWMVGDLRRGVDVLLAQPGVDRDRVVLLGAVAGGGDPAGVAAALDPRVKAVVPFNFGGTQPDYAVPDYPDRNFYWFGVPSWEPTRCLRLGARDGFAQWLIVGSVAPRGLIYAHEFAWDRRRDPAWPRLQKVFDLYGASDRLANVEGQGDLKGTPPQSSHCNNVGPLHRAGIYSILNRWFGMPVPEEYSRRRAAEELACLTPAAIQELHPRPLHQLAAEVGEQRAGEARRRLAGLDPAERRQRLRRDWAEVMGDVEPAADPIVQRIDKTSSEHATVERIVLEPEHGVIVPVLLLYPARASGSRLPVVVAAAQEGKQAMLERRPDSIAAWLDGGAAVCLVDVRGTGETRPRDGSRRYNGAAAGLSEAEWMLGRTLVGSRVRDVRSVLRYLRTRSELDARRVALWGDSFAPANPPDRPLAVPLDVDPQPHQAEPLGGLLALFTALYEDDVRAVHVRGGLVGYASILQSPFLYVPHDALIPGALTAGDLREVATALAPRPLRMNDLRDGLNRAVNPEDLARTLEPTRTAYREAGAADSLRFGGDDAAEQWLLKALLASTAVK